MVLGYSPVPDALRDTFDAWHTRGRPQQPPIGWSESNWSTTLPEYADLFQQLPQSIGRKDVTRQCADATADHDHAISGFLAAMVWGYGRVGYGPYRTKRVLGENPDAGETLMLTARSIREGGGPAGFDYLGRHRLKHLGVAFATKYLYFCSVAMKARRTAPILDRVVSNWFADNAGVRLRLDWNSGDYHAYCDTLAHWADQLELKSEDAEYLIFASGIGERSQWSTDLLSLSEPRDDSDDDRAEESEEAAVLTALTDAEDAFAALPDVHEQDADDFERGIRALRRIVLARPGEGRPAY